jgi:hypothetical protein
MRLQSLGGLFTPFVPMKAQAKASMTTRLASWHRYANILRGNRGLVANLGA